MQIIVPDAAMGQVYLLQAQRAAQKLLKFKGTPGVDHGKHDTVVLRDHRVPAHPMLSRLLPFYAGAKNTISGTVQTNARGGVEWVKYNQRSADGCGEKRIAMSRQGHEIWFEMLERQASAMWHVAFRHNMTNGRIAPLEDTYRMLA